MANQFQNKLVSAIREIIANGKPAKVGGLGVFCMVHREPTERIREDGAVVLTPPANVIEFMPDPFLKPSTNDPVIQKLLEDLLYDSDLLKDAIENFATDIYKSSRECSVLVHGLGTFRNSNGKLSYKPAEDLSLEVNAVYEGLKEIEINNTPKFNFNKPRSLQNGPDEDELISVVEPPEVGVKDDPATIYKLSLLKTVKSDEDSITVIPESEKKSISAPPSIPKIQKESFEDTNVSTYNFGDRIGFDDGLANFGEKKTKEKKIVESTKETIQPILPDLTSRLDEFEANFTKIKSFNEPFSEIESEQDEISIVFESQNINEKPQTEHFQESDHLFEVEQEIEESIDIEKSLSELVDSVTNKEISKIEESKEDVSVETIDETKFFENPAATLKNPHDLFEDDLETTSFKINLFGKGQEKYLREKEEAEKKRKEEEQRKKEEEERQRLIEGERKKAEEEALLEQERLRLEEAREAERQRLLEEEQKLLESAARRPYEIPLEEESSDHLGQFNFKRSGKKNINKDYSHLQDSLISPVLPSSNKGTGDKGLSVALSIAAMILFAVMLFLVYSLFPHEEPDFFRANMGTANMENRAALGLDTRTNPAETSANQAQAGNPALTESLASADDVLLELTRQHRGGLFGLQGEYNPNIAPFYGIVIYSSPLRGEADDLAERLRNRDWRTNVIAHQRSDGSRVWRVMIGQFSTVTDANMEARLLPSDLRREFVVQRVD